MALIEVRDPDQFEAAVLGAREPTVVMFGATWCPFCRRFKAEFEKLAGSRPWRFAAVYLDEDSNPLWDDFALEVVPTLALFRNGELVDRLDGVLGYGIDRGMIETFVRRVAPSLR